MSGERLDRASRNRGSHDLGRRASLALVILALPLSTSAQGFAGLGAEAAGFALPDPDDQPTFPQDHGPHALFRVEWWYLTANLEGPDGTPYGLQWTLFRTGLAPGGAPESQLWMAHAAVTTPDAHHAAERLARGGTGQAGVEAEPFDAWLDEWRLSGDLSGESALTAQGPDWGFDATLAAQGPVVLQGLDGYSVKSEDGQASHYYSMPFLAIEGTLHLPEGDIPVAGTAWLDREWSSQPLADRQVGWDWFALSFSSGERLMAFQLRAEGGAPFTAATWIAPDGTPTPLPNGSVRATPLATRDVAGRTLPTEWRLEIPAQSLDVAVAALNPQAWMDTSVPYWEGPVTVAGSHEGRGYLEMTGY